MTEDNWNSLKVDDVVVRSEGDRRRRSTRWRVAQIWADHETCRKWGPKVQRVLLLTLIDVKPGARPFTQKVVTRQSWELPSQEITT
jgi:hypothetical protein